MNLEFSPKVKVLAQEDPATEVDIEKVTGRFPSLPAVYIDIVRRATEIEVEFENGRYLRVWGPLGDDGGGH